MACRDTVGRARRFCVDWERNQIRRCANWRTVWTRRCDDWQQSWERRCSEWETRTERTCDRWETNRRRECDSWFFLFRWLCTGWTWITSTVCRLWNWVTTTICRAWTLVSSLVCRLWVLVSSLVCDLWTFITVFICRTWVTIAEIWCAFWCWLKRLSASTEFSESRSECIYGWTSAYRAELDTKTCTLTITLRIRLNPDAGVTAASLAAARTRWEAAIEAAWGGQHTLVLTDGACTCEVVTVAVDVQFVDNNEHHTVRVQAGNGRANMTNWFENDSGGTAAHEAGHMFGNVDEYADPACPGRNVTNDGSLMQTTAGAVLVRHYESFARWLSNRSCCTYNAQ